MTHAAKSLHHVRVGRWRLSGQSCLRQCHRADANPLHPLTSRPRKSRRKLTPLDGRELFVREWLPNDSRAHGGDGLGPVFNDSSCVACHNQGGIGGGGAASKNVDIITAFPLPTAQARRREYATRSVVQFAFRCACSAGPGAATNEGGGQGDVGLREKRGHEARERGAGQDPSGVRFDSQRRAASLRHRSEVSSMALADGERAISTADRDYQFQRHSHVTGCR